MKKRISIMLLCTTLLFPSSVFANVVDYETTMNMNATLNPTVTEVSDGAGNTVKMTERTDVLYVMSKDVMIRSLPGENADELRKVLLGTKLHRVAVCDNGWSKVTFQKKGEEKIEGYVPNDILTDTPVIEKFEDEVTASKDTDILDYPGIKDGEVVGEVHAEDILTRTGTINDVWSRIVYKDENDKKQSGYILTSALKGQGDDEEVDEEIEAGIIHKSSGEGVFAEAVEGVTSTNGDSTQAEGVMVGTPVSASSDSALIPLGTFKITHYCNCSICCGPWADGITSTGNTAVTNHTIAVDPTQIPYGSKVVINGQIYVAEDCGGAIKTNCIDIYVATHEEGENKGVYYTDVYLLQE